jgi:polysaccharide pyruvyl transferase WcaK-like protein
LRIALVNVFPDSNKGACALTWASLDLVLGTFPGAAVALVPSAVTPADPAPFRHTAPRYPGVTILPPLFDGEGKGAAVLLWRLARKLGEILRFHRRRPSANPTLEWIRNCDLVVSVGGVNFLTAEATIRENPRLVVRLLPLLAAQKIGVPTVMVGAQIGPFEARLSRWIVRRVAAKTAAVLPRDHISAAELRGPNPPRRSILLPDSALSLTVSTSGARELWERRGLDPALPTLALVISSALRANERREAHVALFAHLAKGLMASGVVGQVVVVLQTDEDRDISRDLVHSLGLDPRFFLDDDLDPDQLANLYGACRMVISSRLHAVLLSLLAGRPAISVAPEVTFKERAVLELLGLESLWIPSTTDPDRALERCLEIAASDPDHRRAVASAVSAARKQWGEVPQTLREIVQEGRRARNSQPQAHALPRAEAAQPGDAK